MKRILCTILAVMLVFSMQPCYALLSTDTGATMHNTAGEDWIKDHSAEARVERILNGNIAFIDGQTRMWNKTAAEVMEAVAYYSDGIFYIPSECANRLFGLTIEDEYVTSECIVENTEYKCFTDPRGFCLFSTDISCVKTTYNPNIHGYYDFYTVVYAMNSILWDDIEPTADDYSSYIANWQKVLTVPTGKYSTYSKYYSDYVENGDKIEENIVLSNEGIFSTALSDVSGDEDIVFTDLEINSSAMSSMLYKAYTEVFTIAKTYYMKKAKTITDTEMKNKVIECLDYLYEYYSQALILNDNQGGSWPNYAFNIPYLYGNILCLMYDAMSDEDRIKHTNAIFDRVPDPTTSRGRYAADMRLANLSWCSVAYLNNAILAKDSYRVNYALRYLSSALMYNVQYHGELDWDTDGIYKDGSIKFHNNLAYNTGYGSVNIENFANLLMLSKGTVFDVRNTPYYDNIYTIIENNYLPFYIENIKMKAVSGRYQAHTAIANIKAMIVIANGAKDDDVRKSLSQKIINVIDGYTDSYDSVSTSDYRIMSAPNVQEEYDIFKNYTSEMTAEAAVTSNTIYHNMDRSIYKGDGFSAVFSMNSSRTAKYEALADGSGNTDWYVNEGAVYVYTGDNSQFNTTWMKIADRYAIPGTTVVNKERSTIYTTSTSDPELSTQDWAGGVTDGTNSVLGMKIGDSVVTGSDCSTGLNGNKSYFVINGKIICIGSGIYGGTDEVHTTIDNRQIR